MADTPGDAAVHAPPRRPLPILFAHYGEEGIRGSERVLLDLLRHLDLDTFVPTVWCNAETMASATFALGVETRLTPMPILCGWSAPRFELAANHRLRREARAFIRQRSVHLVHANSGAPNQWLVPAARSCATRYVTHLHAHYVLRDRCTMLLHQAPTIVGCTEAVVAPFVADGISPERVRVIPNGVDEERLNEGNALGMRQHLGIAPTALVVVAAGALIALKGYDVLIRTARVLKERGSRAVFLLAGSGPEEAALRALARDLGVEGRVHFLGARRDVGAIFRDVADVVMAPSRQEAFGLTVAEAALFGVPAVASDIPGLRETVLGGHVGGVLSDSGAPHDFADAIERLERDPALRLLMGQAAQAYARDNFTVRAMVRRFEELYGTSVRQWGAMHWSPWRRLGAQWVRNRVSALTRPAPQPVRATSPS